MRTMPGRHSPSIAHGSAHHKFSCEPEGVEMVSSSVLNNTATCSSHSRKLAGRDTPPGACELFLSGFAPLF